MTISITLACERYDRTEALRDGRVRPAGVGLTHLPQKVEEAFFRIARFPPSDAAEMSLSSYVVSLTQDAPFIALPVFPSRLFRHSGIHVSAGSGVERPEDLVGKQVGVAEYQFTANVWNGGILADRHGVPVESVTYRTGGLPDRGRPEKAARPAAAGDSRSTHRAASDVVGDMCHRGDRRPAHTTDAGKLLPWRQRSAPAVRSLGGGRGRLLPEDGDLPDHARRRPSGDVYEHNRSLARSLYDALTVAKTLCSQGTDETATARYLFPWQHDEVARTKRLLGDGYQPYGLESNRDVLSTFLRYPHARGLAARPLRPEDLFAPETLEATRV